jgi:hypothetical protein
MLKKFSNFCWNSTRRRRFLLNWKTEMITLDQLIDIIAKDERLNVEFNSDQRQTEAVHD